MNWRLALNPVSVALYLKQEHLYRSYLKAKSAHKFYREYVPLPVGRALRILDFGCGRGRHVALLSRFGNSVTGVDVRHHTWWKKVSGAKFAAIRDHHDLSDTRLFPDNHFDLCLCFLVLYLIEDDEWALSQIQRIVKTDGWLVLQVPNAENLWTKRTGRYLNGSEPIKRYYAQESITGKLKQAGFNVERIWYEKYYPATHLRTVNTILALLPVFAGRWLANRLPERNRGVINIWAQKL